MEGIVFVGIQASGKTTFYKRNYFDTHVRIGLDMLKTRNKETILLNACVSAKQPFVIDNTNPSVVERKKYIIAARDNGFTTKCYYFQSNLKDCLGRNQQRSGKKNIPEIGVKGTYNKLEIPSYGEGFDEMFYVYIKNNELFVKEWKNEIR
ncbi:MAG: ATP-binding protein [Gammaproteobacteria bacterium]|nr:ATP-binding protein [Gammaproteobacteria bacterium]MDH5803301.1 ATP-binding protein [Gammaproteobacteria bacterium]